MTLEQLGTVGAEVHGVEGSQLVDDGALPGRCMDALEEHGVLVFRGLHVDDETQVTFSKRLDDVGKAEPAEAPRIFTVTLDPAKNPIADYLRGTFAWHIDGAQDEVPAKATILSAKVVATEGGETEFASTYAAYDELDDVEKDRLEGVRVLHSFEASQRLGQDPLGDPLELPPEVVEASGLVEGSHGHHRPLVSDLVEDGPAGTVLAEEPLGSLVDVRHAGALHDP